ncbi:MAG: DNA-processing protein DprA [Gemmatimonadales bacterium]
MLSSEEREAYLALSLASGIGTVRLGELKRFFGTWTGALAAPVALLGTVPSMNRAAAAAVAAADRRQAVRILDMVTRLGAFVLTPYDAGFPEELSHIPDPPALLFGAGRRELLGRPGVALVGTRHPSSYGVEVTRRLAADAAAAGLVVVSGMARGLDAVAHWAAVEAGGDTIGILGNGIDVVYPAANRALYHRVIRDGLLLTEFPPGERPNAGSFPRRNRLISGLARATVIIEAAGRSGALITARTALDQGREVLAVPGPITSRTSVGPNELIRDGAAPVLGADDLLRPFGLSAAPGAGVRPEEAGLREDLRRVFEVLDGVPRTIDALAVELGLATGATLACLAELEIVGLAERNGQEFRRAP